MVVVIAQITSSRLTVVVTKPYFACARASSCDAPGAAPPRPERSPGPDISLKAYNSKTGCETLTTSIFGDDLLSLAGLWYAQHMHLIFKVAVFTHYKNTMQNVKIRDG